MMLLVPLGRKDQEVFPVLTGALMLAIVVVFLITWPMQQREASTVGNDDLKRTAANLASILRDPASGLAEPNRAAVSAELTVEPFPSARLKELFAAVQADRSKLDQRARYEWDLAYPVFESYARSAGGQRLGTTVFKRWGFNPDGDWFPGLVTHVFLHQGWLHLMFNLIFLWVGGAIAEEKIGAHMLWVFATGGAAAAIAQTLAGLQPNQTLIGASGAISALLGLALVMGARETVKLFYFVLVVITPKYGVFDSPLWFFLPVWLLSQIAVALLTTKNETVGVATMAHIGGFAYGCLIGSILSRRSAGSESSPKTSS